MNTSTPQVYGLSPSAADKLRDMMRYPLGDTTLMRQSVDQDQTIRTIRAVTALGGHYTYSGNSWIKSRDDSVDGGWTNFDICGIISYTPLVINRYYDCICIGADPRLDA